jgi:flagellar biosynthetic protein FliP
MKTRNVLISTAILLALSVCVAHADPLNVTAFTSSPGANGSTTYSLNLKIIAGMTALMVLPALLMTMTSFTRIIIVFSILRQALGLPSVPSNQILIGLSLILTLFIMSPIINKINDTALQPYIKSKITESVALDRGSAVMKTFMLKQTRKIDLNLFVKLSKKPVASPKDVSIMVLMPAFLTSELKTAFQMGFFLYLPFLIIDLVIASILMSMGMMMLSPLVISLPFKIMLFVLVNGWTLIIGTLATSFGVT